MCRMGEVDDGPRAECNKLRVARLTLWGSIASLEGPEYLSQERRAQIAEQLRAQVDFIVRMERLLNG